MKFTVARRVGIAIGAGMLIAAAWSGTAQAASTPAASPATTAVVAAPAASGRHWCGFSYDKCVQDQNTFQHYGYKVSPIYYAEGNTCTPEHTCNGYWFDWWE
ncbi:hypothetical protein [Fodinicola acaciae]|uniref:hypothetical protein n=1 Tax=Fodinicola acaciae TaxID=2681555 RepID=UPI0013D3863F|nr:hypothetical protein [Fodinicola acaciae]